MFIKEYSDFRCQRPTFIHSPSHIEEFRSKVWCVSFKPDQDVRCLFPYINSILDNAVYYEQPEHVRFLFKGYRCRVYPEITVAYFFESRITATEFASDLIVYLNDIYKQRESITPNHEQIKHVPIIDILKVLPKNNCRECGYLTCTAFAAALVRGKIAADKCPSLASPMRESAVYPIFDGEGNVVDSVSLPISTSMLKNRIEEQREYILMLEASLRTSKQHQNDQNATNEIEANAFELSGREIEVLKFIAEGYTNNEISSMLFISSHTVKSHMINIFNKLGVNDRTQAAVLATRKKII